jgi:IMP dehydrogenase
MARIVATGYSFDDVLIVPKYNKVRSRSEVNFRTRVTRNHSIDIPLIAANMDTVCDSGMAISLGILGGLGVIHRFMSVQNEVMEVVRVKAQRLVCAAAIGIGDYVERVAALVDAGVDILVLDIAHGHSKYAGKVLDWIKENYSDVDVMVGNIVTKDAAEYFLSKGADAIKVGIGPGSMCTTRIMTGAGVPQITAIMDVYEATKGEIPICADGGVVYPGDLVKALGAGAETIMSGSLFAGTEESPGEVIKRNGRSYKLYRGMASFEATMKKIRLNRIDKEIISIEGVKTLVPYAGPIEPIVDKFIGGLASGMTYIGAREMKNLVGKADFIHITNSGIEKSRAQV